MGSLSGCLASAGSDRFSESVCRSLKSGTNLGEFPGSQVDTLLLNFRSLVLRVGANLLRVGALSQRLQLGRHLLHRVSELGQLPGDACYVVISGDPTRFYGGRGCERSSL